MCGIRWQCDIGFTLARTKADRLDSKHNYTLFYFLYIKILLKPDFRPRITIFKSYFFINELTFADREIRIVNMFPCSTKNSQTTATLIVLRFLFFQKFSDRKFILHKICICSALKKCQLCKTCFESVYNKSEIKYGKIFEKFFGSPIFQISG